MRTLAKIIFIAFSLLYTPAWGNEHEVAGPHHAGCRWWGVIGTASGVLLDPAEGHVMYEGTFELSVACLLELAHSELSLEPTILVPVAVNGEFNLGIAPGLNLTWYLYNHGPWHVGPRAGFNLRGNLPIGHDGGIGVMWHAGAEAEYVLVHEKMGLFGAVQYAGEQMWRLGEHAEAEHSLHGPEVVFGLSFHLQ